MNARMSLYMIDMMGMTYNRHWILEYIIKQHELFLVIKIDGVLMRCCATCHFAGPGRVSRVSWQSVPTVPCSTDTSFPGIIVLGGGDRDCVVAGGLRCAV